MNDLQRLLDAQSRRTAGVVTAAVVARNADGSYRVRNVATGSERDVEKAAAGDEFTPGEYVTVGSPSNARAVLGSRDVILSRSRQQRGASQTVPETTTDTIATPAIFAVSPDPIELEAGGAPVAATVYGTGFVGLLPIYGDAGITNNAAPVVTATTIALSLVAGAGVSTGAYALTVGSAVRAGAIEVTAPPPPVYVRVMERVTFPLNAAGSGSSVWRVLRSADGGGTWAIDTDHNGTAVPGMAVWTPEGGIIQGPYDSTTAPAGWTIPALVTFVAGETTVVFDVPMPGPLRPGGSASTLMMRLISGTLGASDWWGRFYIAD